MKPVQHLFGSFGICSKLFQMFTHVGHLSNPVKFSFASFRLSSEFIHTFPISWQSFSELFWTLFNLSICFETFSNVACWNLCLASNIFLWWVRIQDYCNGVSGPLWNRFCNGFGSNKHQQIEHKSNTNQCLHSTSFPARFSFNAL